MLWFTLIWNKNKYNMLKSKWAEEKPKDVICYSSKLQTDDLN